jgi:hypothetical protein
MNRPPTGPSLEPEFPTLLEQKESLRLNNVVLDFFDTNDMRQNVAQRSISNAIRQVMAYASDDRSMLLPWETQKTRSAYVGLINRLENLAKRDVPNGNKSSQNYEMLITITEELKRISGTVAGTVKPRDELLWHCLHRLASVLEARLEYSEDPDEVFAYQYIIKPAFLEGIDEGELVRVRMSYGVNNIGYEFPEKYPDTDDIIQVRYDKSRQAIIAETQNWEHTVKFTITTGLLVENPKVDTNFIASCKKHIKTYVAAMQTYYNTNKNIKGYSASIDLTT